MLPGVDVQMKAADTGFQQLLIVKTPQAAKAPALKRLTFALKSDGVAIHTDQAGNLKAINPAGQEVFTAPTPTMWDSTGIPTSEDTPAPQGAKDTPALMKSRSGQAPTSKEDVFEPRDGAQQSAMPIAVGNGQLVLEPDQDILHGKDTVFPVYIDPTVAGSRDNWTSVSKQHPSTSFFNHSSKIARSGYEAETGGTWRSMFTMNTKNLHGKQITRSVFRIKNTHSWSCTKKPVELWRTNSINSGTTWNNQPAWAAKVGTVTDAKGWSSGCPAGNLEFDTTDVARIAAANKWPTSTLGLRASESDTGAWKKFDASTAVLSTTYNTVPNTPNGHGTSPATACTAEPSTTVGNTDVDLYARVSDADGGTVAARFKVWQTGTSTVLFEKTVNVTSGSIARIAVPKGKFVDGRQHSWQVRAEDAVSASGWTGVCRFHVDQSRPSRPPGITSPQFPNGDLGWEPDKTGTARTEGTFTLDSGGVGDVVKYEYWTDWDPTVRTITPAAAGGSHDVKLTPPSAGPKRVYARSLDRANNRSGTRNYLFYANSPAVKDKPGDLNGDGHSDFYGLRSNGERGPTPATATATWASPRWPPPSPSTAP
ncbi:hypothetical protein [Streptomyces sp. HUAS TT7]|uniref:hypothetical protein n=1 Tax=Streptomyces sp. HUAS TT7 TaxID=3447507 RepID=UPI003F654B5F